MDINIYINQKKINPLFMKGINEYAKRLTPYCHLFIKASSRNKNPRIGKDIRNIYVATGTQTALDISSEEFAAMIGKTAASGISHINFYIGSMQVNDMTKFRLCTLSVSEDMEVLMLSEQIYRAFTILNNITYHK